MMPIRDVVIFPYMMTPFVVGRESSVHALEEALAADKKIFLATQHDASIDEPKPNEIYQVGTVVNIVQSLKLPDGNIKVLVEGIERGKILQVTETEGFMQASVRLARYATETNPQIEAGMQRVTGLFEQYVKLCQSLNYETMIAAVRMEDPAKLTDTIASWNGHGDRIDKKLRPSSSEDRGLRFRTGHCRLSRRHQCCGKNRREIPSLYRIVPNQVACTSSIL